MIQVGKAPVSWARRPRVRRGYPEFEAIVARKQEQLGDEHPSGQVGFGMASDQPRILVIEDDRVLQALLAEVLVSEGYVLLQSGNGTDGLRLARQHRPDVILLDLVVPGTPGLEVLEALKAQSETRDIPVIVISASARLMLATEARRAEAVLQKPFGLDELLQHVQAVLSPGRSRVAHAGVS